MDGYSPGEQPTNLLNTIKLNTNENPYRASEKAYDAIREILTIGLSRYPNPVGEKFREAAAEKFNICPESILCGNGSDDLLTILTRTFVDSGDTIRLAYPSYSLYLSLAQIQGAKSEMIKFNNDWTLPDEFYKSSNQRLRLAFLPNPNSPSGTVIPKSRILEIAERLPCPLVVDEAYADFAEESCMDLVNECERIIITRTFSKSYSLAGMRFGFLAAAPQLINQMMKVKDSYNCDTISIAAATAAINDNDWLKNNRKKIIETRTRLTKKMKELGFNVPNSQANFTWNTNTKYAAQQIYEYLKSNGILVRYMNYKDWGDGLRISVGTDDQIDKCLKYIETYMSQSNS
jgi:histidinol-phosphate aminotransferase